MSVRAIDHFNIRAPRALLERVRDFYRDAIGLRDGERPPFRSFGFWLYAGEKDILHLSTAQDDGDEPLATGRFNHVALACDDLAAMRARLDAAGIEYEIDEVPQRGQTQVFVVDPAGVMVELNFAGSPNA